MPQKLMDVLDAWPLLPRIFLAPASCRRQLLSGVPFPPLNTKYDWKAMKRIKRVDGASEASAETKQGKIQKKPTWVPRARRLTLQTPVRYRPKGLGTWHEGTVENLSQSGVLLYGPQQLPDNTLVEMVFEMPEEISGRRTALSFARDELSAARMPAMRKQSDSRRQFSITSSCATTDRGGCCPAIGLQPIAKSGLKAVSAPVYGSDVTRLPKHNFAQDRNAFCI